MNTHVQAQTDAPSITRLLAEFVAQHPSNGWSEAVEEQRAATTEISRNVLEEFNKALDASIGSIFKASTQKS